MLLQYKLSRPGGQFGPEYPGQITQIAWSLCPGMTRQFNPEVGRFTSVAWSVCPGIPGQASRNAMVKYRRNTFQCCRGTSDQFQRYTQARTGKEKSNIYALVDLDETLTELHDFSVTRNEKAHVYALHVPGFSLQDANMVHDDIDPHVKYYELLLNELLSGIVGHVSKYAYATASHQQYTMQINELNNANFRKWMRSFTNSGKHVRLYTLNYDDIFKRLIEQEGAEVFDGFFADTAHDPYQAIPDLKRVVTQRAVSCHFNLHGSWYWRVEERNENQLKGYRYLKSIPGVIDGSAASIEIEKGKRLLLTNIISGYQKVQKTAISPFRQFFSALDRDCMEAEELYLVGYSYGDEHVNDIIRNARRNNPALRITLINPGFDDLQFALSFLSNWGEPRLGIYEKVAENAVFSKQFQVLALKDKFSDFLKSFAEGTNESYW